MIWSARLRTALGTRTPSARAAFRLTAPAAPDEVLVSRTVKDLVAGSGFRFQDHGVHGLRGAPGEWRLFAVERLER
jgi:class 3 adenylate cyclase